jgi:predicted nuclease of restriction endonuclease-like RecB superfamily
MLTGELIRTKTVKKQIVPSFISTTSTKHVARAEELISLMSRALDGSWTRGQVGHAVTEICSVDVDHKITKGMAKLLMDKGTFETQSPQPPAELRWAVFREAARRGPLALEANTEGRLTAKDVLKDVAEGLGCEPAEVMGGMYADLKDHQVLAAMKLPKPEAHVHRYNSALVQAILLKASHITLRLTQPKPKYVRQLLRYLKFYQLMFRARTVSGDVEVEIDGPQSLLNLSTRYGMQLANFFPAVLLQSGDWTMEAALLWGRKRKFKKVLILDSTMGLQSHYKDTGTWTSRAETWFLERFEQLDHGWTVGPGEPMTLGGQQMMVPDLTFKKDGRVGHLDIVGFWRANHLKDHLAALPANVIVAVSSKLKGEKAALPASMAASVIRFAEVIPAAKVLDALESNAC